MAPVGLNVPAAHAVHADPAADEYLPAEQVSQLIDLEYNPSPAAHALHAAAEFHPQLLNSSW